jgi:ribonucleoside-diphosphate reductase alpha chain
VSKGLTRGQTFKVVSSAEPKGFAGGSNPSGTPAPTRAVPTALSGSNVRSLAGGAATVTALKPTIAALAEEATAFKRDYEEKAREAEEASEGAETTAELFTQDAAKEAAEAKAVAATRRQKAIMQGYTGNMCSECQNFTMVRNGTCEKCDTCGATSGCS